MSKEIRPLNDTDVSGLQGVHLQPNCHGQRYKRNALHLHICLLQRHMGLGRRRVPAMTHAADGGGSPIRAAPCRASGRPEFTINRCKRH